MYAKIKDFLVKYRNVISYLFFGVMTTVVNYIVYYPLFNFANLSAALSNGLAWIAAVVFAFLANKPFVFKSLDWSAKVVVPEFIKFAGCRIASGLLETVFLYVTVDISLWNGNIMKLIISILVVILNYVTSKLFVFYKSSE